TRNIQKAFEQHKKIGITALTSPVKNPAGDMHYYVSDNSGNWFDIVESSNSFSDDKGINGGVYGMVIGVSDMEKSLKFYGDLLGFDTVLSDTTGMATDLSGVPGSNHNMRRVILGQSKQSIGPFNPLLG